VGRKRRIAPLAVLAAVFVATLFERPGGPTSIPSRIFRALSDWWSPSLPPATPAGDFVRELIQELTFGGFTAVHVLLYGAMLATAGGLALRALARTRLREGQPDPLEALRRRPTAQRALSWVPPLGWGLLALRDVRLLVTSDWLWEHNHPLWMLAAWASVAALYGVGFLVLGRIGVARLLAPVETETRSEAPRSDDEMTFSAVAVTARTRAAVAAMALAAAVMVAWVLSLPLPSLMNQPGVIATIAAYVAASAAAAAAFRRRSRIAVGIDGVRVGDEFYAYRNLDDARARGADLELVKNGRAILRLQMHSDDAGRRDEVLARVRARVATAKQSDTRGAEAIVQAMPRAHVASASVGGESYRFPALSREQLWELVEGPTTDSSTRTAAAEALAVGLDGADRSRLRVAAEHCADPRVRVALAGIMADGAGDGVEETRFCPEDGRLTGRAAGPR
jgi:hypothetical protein